MKKEENKLKKSKVAMAPSQPSRVSRQSKMSEVTWKSTKSVVFPSEELVEGLLVIPPDGGWGWMVVSMAFVCNFIVDGVMYTFGIFLDEISESFNVEPTQIALANSLMSGFYFVIGPLTCALLNRYGFRVVGILGGVISSTAFLLSTIFDNVTAFLILIGCVCGIGFNMIYMPSLLIVGFYFERWRALATCLAVCGSSIGVIVFPPMITNLLKNLNWRWKFRVLSGFTFATLLCSYAYRPIKPVRVVEEKKIGMVDDNITIRSLTMDRDRSQSLRKIFQRYHNNLYPTISDIREDPYISDNLSRISENSSTLMQMFASNNSSFTTIMNQSMISRSERDFERRSNGCVNCCKKFLCCCGACNRTPAHERLTRPMYRDDILYGGSLFILSEYSRATLADGPSAKKSTANYHMSVTRVATAKDMEQSTRCVCCPEAVIRTMATMVDVSLLKSPSFLILTASGFITMIGHYSPFIFLVERAKEMGINEEWGALLLTFVGIANAIGRIMCGIISSFPKTDTIIISYITMFITGAATILSNYVYSLEWQIVCAVLFGLNLASFAALRSIVLVDLLGLENLTNAFGITAMFYGIASFIGVPVAGFLRHYTGKYEVSFLFAGCSFIFGAILMIPIRTISKWEATKKKPKVTFKA